MNTVWVPKTAGHDLTAAKHFGQLITVIPEHMSPFMTDRIYQKTMEILPDINDGDYLLLCGPPVISTVLAANWPWPTIRCLIWHARERKYIVREVKKA